MNSTEEDHLLCFFERLRGPVAYEIRERRGQLFPLGPDNADSWYVNYDPGTPEFVTVETHDLVDDLRRMWLEQDLPELARLADEFIEIAGQLRLGEEETADISPFIYVMY